MKGEWTKVFNFYEELAMERICEILPECEAVLSENPHEDEITFNLVSRFSTDSKLRRYFHHWEFHFEPRGTDENGAYYSKGIMDSALFWDARHERYLGFEAKKLNVIHESKKRSLVSEYVGEGLGRFVSGKYSADIPLGCMLGYVMDGNVAGVKGRIFKVLHSEYEKIRMVKGPVTLNSINASQRFETMHERKGSSGSICVRHSHLPFNATNAV